MLDTQTFSHNLLAQRMIDHLAGGGRIKMTLKHRGRRPCWNIESVEIREVGGQRIGSVTYTSRRCREPSLGAVQYLSGTHEFHFE